MLEIDVNRRAHWKEVIKRSKNSREANPLQLIVWGTGGGGGIATALAPAIAIMAVMIADVNCILIV
jgi:hypothetical protein